VSIGWKSSVSYRRLLSLGLGLCGLGLCHSWSLVARGQEAKIPAKTASAIKPAAPSAQDSPSQGNATLPAIVAAVNGQTISRDELAKLCLERSGDEVLDNVLHKFVIMQACQAQQLMISQKDVDDEIGRIATKFNLTTNMYLKLIEDQRDITPEQYAADVVWPMLALRALARDKAEVSQAEVDQAYQAEYGPKVQVRMIAVDDPVKAQELWQQAKAEPAKFKVLAKQFSQDPASASVEGLLPPIRRYGEEDPIEKVAFSLQPDQVSEVFSVGEMFLCLQCVRHLPGSTPSSAQMEEIQSNLRRELEDVKLRKIAESIFQVLREQSSIVKVFGNKELEQQHPGVAALINRQALPLKTLEDECLKRAGPKVLDGAIHRKILEGALKAQAIEITQADLDQEIARAAEYYGMVHPDGRPNVEAWLQEVLREDGTNLELYLSDVVWPTVALKKMIADKVAVTEEDFQKGFEANYGPRAEVLAIVCSNQRTAQEVWQMARDNPTEQFFGELASQYSVEPSSRSNYGKIPPLRRHSGQPTLEAAAFKLQPGELSGIIETGGQYVILRSQGMTTPVVSSPEAVRAELSKDLLEKKQRVAMEKQLEGLLAAAQIDNFLVPKSQLGTAATQASLKMLQEEPAVRR
jgi:parvulin-like peptidyl-prolyl isomerase